MAVAVKFKIETDASSATNGLKAVNTGLNEVAKKSESTSTSIAKGFIKAELAMRGVRAAMKFAVDGLKEFEKETGKAQGFTQLSKTFKDLQLQVGSVLAPAVTQFADLVAANFDKIAAFVRTAVGTIVNAFNGWLAIIEVLKIGFAEFAKAINNILATMVGGLQKYYELWGKLPGALGESSRAVAKDLGELKGSLLEGSKFWDDYSKKAQGNLDNVVSKIEEVNRAARTGTTLKSGGADSRKAANEAAAKAAKEKAAEMEMLAKEMDKMNDKLDADDEKRVQMKAENLEKIQERYYTSALGSAEAFNATSVSTLQKSKAEYLELVEQQYSEALALLAISTEKKIQAGGNEILLISEQQTLELEITATYLNKKYEITNNYYSKIKDLTEKEATENATTLKNAQDNINRITEEIQTQSLAGRIKNVEAYNTKVNETYMAAFEKGLINEEEYSKASSELAQYTEDLKVQIVMDSIAKQVDAYAQLANTTVAIFENIATIRINQIERERKAEIKAVNASVGSSKEKAEKVEEINKEMDKKIREQKKKEQGYAIASALIAGAVASMNMWQGAMQLGPIAGVIVGAIGQALLVALTATEVGIITSQEFAKGGIVQGNPAAGDVQNVKATGGEVVMNRDQQARTLMAIANGGSSSGTPSIRGGDTYVTIQGNADENILAEALNRSRMSQMQDMKQLLRQMQYNGSIRLAVA